MEKELTTMVEKYGWAAVVAHLSYIAMAKRQEVLRRKLNRLADWIEEREHKEAMRP